MHFFKKRSFLILT